MIYKTILSFVILFVTLTTTANAALEDSGIYTTDTVTGLQWLDLTQTAGITSYNGASGVFSSAAGGGWRYATNAQVENLYSELFGNPTLDPVTGSGNFGTTTGEYTNILNMHSLFGSHGITSTTTFSRGWYEDEDGILRMMGSSIYANIGSGVYSGTIYGPEQNSDFDFARDKSSPSYGVYAVRGGLTSVPVPAAVWLFGSGLLGLIGFSRRQKVA